MSVCTSIAVNSRKFMDIGLLRSRIWAQLLHWARNSMRVSDWTLRPRLGSLKMNVRQKEGAGPGVGRRAGAGREWERGHAGAWRRLWPSPKMCER